VNEVAANYSEEMPGAISEADPAEMRLPTTRMSGADPWKLHRQIRDFGSSKVGMPPLFVYEDPDGILEIFDGVTRATRMAKLSPGVTVPYIVIGHYRKSRAAALRVKDRL